MDMDISVRIMKQNTDAFSNYFCIFWNYCVNEDDFSDKLTTH